jgi:hypothetical protein
MSLVPAYIPTAPFPHMHTHPPPPHQPSISKSKQAGELEEATALLDTHMPRAAVSPSGTLFITNAPLFSSSPFEPGGHPTPNPTYTILFYHMRRRLTPLDDATYPFTPHVHHTT